MQCKNCGSRDFQKSTSDYYICGNCGSLFYDDKYTRKKSKPLSDVYFILIIGTGVMIVTILILLFVTASSKKGHVKHDNSKPAVTAEKK
ncbi:MAG TPA: hypothetical protein PK358_02525 [Spirochaetota bacterium]|nr:hypothetical protein [Spirochaetota bacterium]HPJ33681.1 hypothetical protein [Spirochaetota bacterium]